MQPVENDFVTCSWRMKRLTDGCNSDNSSLMFILRLHSLFCSLLSFWQYTTFPFVAAYSSAILTYNYAFNISSLCMILHGYY